MTNGSGTTVGEQRYYPCGETRLSTGTILQTSFSPASAGIESAIYAENNFFRVNPSTGITPDQFIAVFRGTVIHESGTFLNAPSQSGKHMIDAVAAYNAVNDPDLAENVGWVPTLFVDLMETQDVPSAVEAGAGPFSW